MELASRLSALTGRPSAPTCVSVSASSPCSPTTFTASRANKEQFLAAVSGLCSALSVEDKRLAIAYAERGVSRVQDSRYDAVVGLGASIRINRKLHGGAYVPHATEANLAWALIAQARFEEADTLLAESLEECSPLQVAFKFYPTPAGDQEIICLPMGNLGQASRKSDCGL
ncbi:tetratricopeptide repeat domain containing protein [Beauveria brongniartii RCEF 3172]|uniref:Tetratricopeptide repeat domain containing protein n=1 Tax=Beauveria brongniartii RCEF 3172 TaxID=1081107 RepID=A0A167HUW9_9HYPO|nr:tetratricopeptide repeat domain containing protein [Beauveria brongniartii RCEF 3172]